jgi:hypothetical protein
LLLTGILPGVNERVELLQRGKDCDGGFLVGLFLCDLCRKRSDGAGRENAQRLHRSGVGCVRLRS